MKNFVKKHKIQITIGGFILIVIPLAIWGMRSLTALIESDVETLQEYQITQQVQQEELVRLPELENTTQHITQNHGTVNILLEDTDDAKIELFGQIEQLARDTKHSDIKLTVEQYTKPQQLAANVEKKEGVGENPASQVFYIEPAAGQFLYLHIRSIGTFNDAIAFLQKIDNMPYLSDVISLQMRAHDAGVDPRTFEGGGVDVDFDSRPNLIQSDFFVAFYFSGAQGIRANFVNSGTSGNVVSQDPGEDIEFAEAELERALPENQ